MALLSTESLRARWERWQAIGTDERKKRAREQAKLAKKARTALEEFEANCVHDEVRDIDAWLDELRKYEGQSDASRVVRAGLAEAKQLKRLREEIVGENLAKITRADGTLIHERTRYARARRTRELREQLTAHAERLQAQGDYVAASRYRIDALRARHCAEYELQIRPTLPGY